MLKAFSLKPIKVLINMWVLAMQELLMAFFFIIFLDFVLKLQMFSTFYRISHEETDIAVGSSCVGIFKCVYVETQKILLCEPRAG